MTVIEKKMAQPEVKSYLIDSIRFKDLIKETVGAICRDTSILKLVEAQALPDKLLAEFGCFTLNVVLCQR